MRTGDAFGIAEAEPEIDFKAVMAHVREVAAATAPAVSAERLATLGVTVIKAEARFIGRRRLVAGDTEIRARRYVLATGSSPVVPAIPGIEEIGCLTSDTVFELGRRPGHLIILGGSSTGLELAQAFRRLGSQVTVLEAATVLPGEDPEMAAVVVRRLRAEGVIIREGVKATAVERRGKTSVRVLIETEAGAGEVDGSHLLVAAGRMPDIGGLDLKKARVALKGNAVDVSAMLRTTNRRIYAIGDVTGAPQSAQMATYHADLVLKALLFRLPAKDRAIVPRSVHTDPELAHVGLTEAQAAKRHRRLTILRWPYAENDRARAERKTEGPYQAGRGTEWRHTGRHHRRRKRLRTYRHLDARPVEGAWPQGYGLVHTAAPDDGRNWQKRRNHLFCRQGAKAAGARRRASAATFRLRQAGAAAEDIVWHERENFPGPGEEPPTGSPGTDGAARARAVDQAPRAHRALRDDRGSPDLPALDRQFQAALAGGAAGDGGRRVGRARAGRFRRACPGRCRTTC